MHFLKKTSTCELNKPYILHIHMYIHIYTYGIYILYMHFIKYTYILTHTYITYVCMCVKKADFLITNNARRTRSGKVATAGTCNHF